MLHNMKDTLLALSGYAREKGFQAQLSLHREDSHLLRLANGNVSLNTSQQVITLSVTAYEGKRLATATLVCDGKDQAAMRRVVDQAGAMLPHASPLSFSPTLPVIQQDSLFESNYDPALANITSEDILHYINTASKGLEDDDLRLGGSFSVGSTAFGTMSTATDYAVCWRLSDAQITLVLASNRYKWEINAEQSAERLADLTPEAMHDRLAFLKDKYLNCTAVQLPLGPYRVVFGPAATAEYLGLLTYFGLNGRAIKQGFGIHQEGDIGKTLLSPMVTITEGPDNKGAFALPVDDYGRARAQQAWYDQGMLTGFLWPQAAADEYGQTPTGHDLLHDSFALQAGDKPLDSLQALANAPRDRDILYVPYLHYTGVVNPSEGLITGTSRFGALLLKADGSIQVPYNVRFTEKLTDIFGSKLVWLSNKQEAYNQSNTYGQRNPDALLVPSLMCCDTIQVEISNSSY